MTTTKHNVFFWSTMLFLMVFATNTFAIPFLNYNHDAQFNDTAEQGTDPLNYGWNDLNDGTNWVYGTGNPFNGSKSIESHTGGFHYIGNDYQSTMTADNYSVSGAVYLNSSHTLGSLIIEGVIDASNSFSYGLEYNPVATAGFWRSIAGSGAGGATSCVANTNAWSTFDFNVTNQTINVYVNGNLCFTDTAGDGNEEGIFIGKHIRLRASLANAFDYIDDLHVWNGTLTAAPPANSTPVIFSLLLDKTADNTTLLGFANYTDADGDALTYYYNFFRNGVSFSTGQSGPYPASLYVNFRNETISQNGTYTMQVIASDGLTNSSPTNATPIVITFPANQVPVMVSVAFTTADENQTFIVAANATDAEQNNVYYNVSVFYNNFLQGVETVGPFTAGVNTTIYNSGAVFSQNGTYIIQVKPYDATGVGTAMNSSARVLFYNSPAAPPVTPEDSALPIGIFALAIVLVILTEALYRATNIERFRTLQLIPVTIALIAIVIYMINLI